MFDSPPFEFFDVCTDRNLLVEAPDNISGDVSGHGAGVNPKVELARIPK
jgi:hypothetical protein